MWHKATWMGPPMRLALTREGLQTITPPEVTWDIIKYYLSSFKFSWLIDWVFGFYGMSTFVDYLTLSPVYIHIFNLWADRSLLADGILRLVSPHEPHYAQMLGSGPNDVIIVLERSIHHILWYTYVSFKEDRTSSMLTFTKKSLKFITLKNRFLMRAKTLHTMKTC